MQALFLGSTFSLYFGQSIGVDVERWQRLVSRATVTGAPISLGARSTTHGIRISICPRDHFPFTIYTNYSVAPSLETRFAVQK